MMSAESGKRFKPYPTYKDTGVEWLGSISAQWEAMRIKFLARVASGFAPPDGFDRTVGEFPVFGSNGLIGFCDRYFLTEETIVIGRVGASGSVNLAPARSWVSDNALLLRDLRPSADLRWLRYVVESMNLGEQAAKNAQPIITGTFLGNQVLGLPTVEEQRAIAAFLDRETGKIDALVAKKERLIELLQEKHSALITRAVTRGLDPNVPMKDSGVEWLGEIPAHWTVIKGKWIFRLFSGFAFKGEYFSKEDTQAPILVTPGNFHVDGRLYFDDKNTTRYTGNYSDDFLLRKGDLITVLTDLSYKNLILGRTEFVNNDGYLLNQRIAKVMISSKYFDTIDKDYIRYLMNTKLYRDQLIAYTTGATVNHTSPTKFRDRSCLIPPLDEQERIVEKLKIEEENTRALIAKILHAIEKLKEYRTALISAAVTGKIDVREEVA